MKRTMTEKMIKLALRDPEEYKRESGESMKEAMEKRNTDYEKGERTATEIKIVVEIDKDLAAEIRAMQG